MHIPQETLNSYKSALPSGNRLIIDWISISTKYDPKWLISFLGLENCPWEVIEGYKNGYSHHYEFGNIRVYFSFDMSYVKGYYLLEMSGQGCRTFETHGNGDYEKLFDLVRMGLTQPREQRITRITRIDVAYDDLSGDLDLDLICNKTKDQEFVSRFKDSPAAIFSKGGNSSTFGRRAGNCFIRIYDKALERGYNEEMCAKLEIAYPFHWVRCELQLRHDAAGGFVSNLKRDHANIGELYCSVLKNYLSFRDPVLTDSNKRRWPESDFWTKFLNGAHAISLFDRPGVSYNLGAGKKYIFNSAIGWIKTIIKAEGVQKFLDQISEIPFPDDTKYKLVLANYFVDHLPSDLPDHEVERLRSEFLDHLVLDDGDEYEFENDFEAYLQERRQSDERKAALNRRLAAHDYLKARGLDV